MCRVDGVESMAMSMCRVYGHGILLVNSVSLCPASSCTPRPNSTVTPGISWLPTFAFKSPWWKGYLFFFFGVSSKVLIGHHKTSFCLSIPFMGFSRQEYWSALPFPSPVHHILSELSTMTRLSWVALQGMAHSFIELDKTVVHVISLVNFLWLWLSFCLPSDG